MSNFYPRTVNSEVQYIQQYNHQYNKQPPSNENFDNSWIKKHIGNNNSVKSGVFANKKKLTFFFDTLLAYDIKKRSKELSEEKNVELKPDLSAVQTPISHSNDPAKEVEVNSKEQKKIQTELRGKKQTELQFEEYISETWEKYRKCYEHLGEKNPFANDPPSPEFLLHKDKLSRERELTSSNNNEHDNKYKSDYKNEDTSLTTCEDTLEKIVSPISDDEHLNNDNDLKYVPSTSILKENNTVDSLEPDLEPEAEELDYESGSGPESDQILNCDDSFLPIEGEPQLGNDATESQTHDSKQSATNFIEDNVIERFSEYDEIKYYKPKSRTMKATIPDVRTLSNNKENVFLERNVQSSTRNIANNAEFQRTEKGSNVFRKSIKKTPKQYVKTNTHESFRPLVNPYLISQFGSPPMIPQPNSLYPFQPPSTPFNFWMPKPPFNQFNMFPYGYPWQGLPFTPPYFHPFFHQGLTPNPCLGTPLVGDHNINQSGSTQSLINDPSTDLSSGLEYGSASYRSAPEIPSNEPEEFKSNYNQVKRVNRPYHPHFQKSEFINSHPGHQVQHVHSFQQRHRVNRGPNQLYRLDHNWVPENEINNGVHSPNVGRESMQIFDAPDVRQNQMHIPYQPRSNTSSLPSESRILGSPSPPVINQHWNRDHSNLGLSGHKIPLPYIHQQQQGMNNLQYGTPKNEQGRTRVRSNNEFIAHHLHHQPQVQPSSYQHWFPEPPQFGNGDFTHPSESTEGLPA